MNKVFSSNRGLSRGLSPIVATQGPVIVLLTVNNNETDALLDVFLGEGAVPNPITKGGVTYTELGIHGGHRIVNTICEMGAGGVGASQQRTRQAIEHWNPSAIIAVGIAFGLDEAKQSVGDVLVSKQIQDYELGRINENGTLTPRGDKPSCSDVLRNRLRQTDRTERRRQGNDWPKVHFGLVLSGQKLVDNLDYRESLKELFFEAIGGEMEGVGLYASATEAKVDWIVVKAICDWGYNKNNANKQTCQELAARNAARVIKTALDVGCLFNKIATKAVETGIGGIGQPEHAITEHLSKIAEAELELIRKRRRFTPEQSRAEIRILLGRFENDNGDFRHAGGQIYANVLYWAARLYASQPETLSEAITYRDQLKELVPAADVRIIDAWILALQDDVDAALRTVRDIDTDDGRSNLFTLLSVKRGADEALAWWREHPNRFDPAFFTGIGWFNVAVVLAQSGLWPEVLNCLSTARIHVENFPALIFLQGMLNAAMLLPEPLRQEVLKTPPYMMEVATIEGEEADRCRIQALECFASAVQYLEPLGLHKPVQQARLMQFWLRLTDPQGDIVEAARREITESTRDCSEAVHLLPLIHRFNIPFDPGPIRRHLDLRKQLGGLDHEEILAEFTLALLTLQPGELADVLEREEERFTSVLHRSRLTGYRIKALVEDNRYDRAMVLLEERKNDFPHTEVERIRLFIDDHAGVDIRERAEALYRRSEADWLDLHNLVNILWKSGEWVSLRPKLEKLFHLEPTLENAQRFVRCLSRMPTPEDHATVVFLEGHQNLAARSHELLSDQAWSLFRLGRWQEAEAIVRRLLLERTAASDILLDTNLSLQAGDWERFAVIVDREWSRREEHDPDTLLRLATLAAESDVSVNRAFELARLATEKSPDNPAVLVSAYSLTFQIGYEKEADPSWLTRAAKGSTDAGPVWPVDLRKIVEEIIPAQRERSQKINEGLIRGEIPLHFAAAALNSSLSNILLDLPLRNVEEADGRSRVVIPIFSGNRNAVEINTEWTVGFDVTSLLVLHHLDLLQQTLRTFHRVALAPDTMFFLLNERRRSRFHQPSRVKKAEVLRSHIGRSLLEMDSLSEPPDWLVEEVGQNSAQLLEAAKVCKGRVVHPLPMRKLKSFMEEKAELQEYGQLLVSTVTFARLLNDNGLIDTASYDRARGYLLLHDQDHECALETEILEQPLFLDELSLTYLQEAGLLPSLVRAECDLRVHPSLRREQEALIEVNRYGERLAESLDRLRRILREALFGGKAFFLPYNIIPSDDSHEESWLKTPVLTTFLRDTSPCDAICLDDRCLNQHSILTDEKGRTVTVLCSLDILGFLETKGVITIAEKEEKLHLLREGCFGLVPTSSGELKRQLDHARFDAKGQLVETPELRAIRQTLMRIRSLDMLQQPLETPYLDKLRLECLQVLSKLWKEDEYSPEQKMILSDWIWRNLMPSPLDWWRTARDKPGLRPLNEAFGNHLAFLLMVNIVAKDTHKRVFREWIENMAVAPLLPANSKLLNGCTSLLKDTILQISETPLKKSLFAKHLCDVLLPRPIRGLLLQDETFCAEMGLTSGQHITVGKTVHINDEKLFDAIRRLLSTRTEQTLSDIDGRSFKLALGEDTVILKNLPSRAEPWSTGFPELMILSPLQNERLRAFDAIFHFIGPTVPDILVDRAVAAERELIDQEVKLLLTEMLTGVAATQEQIGQAFAEHDAGILEIVPQELVYYEKFCGPIPVGESPEAYVRTQLPEYRKVLLSRDLAAGLDICLLGALRDDLCPGVWLEHESHDSMWDALKKCDLAANPFCLLGALDIALFRQDDERFRNLAADLIESLLKESLPRHDGIDSYRMLTLLAELVLNSLNRMECGPLRQPSWKRMSAWMHAGFLLRLTACYRFDLSALESWAKSQLTLAGKYANFLDLRREPMFSPTFMSAEDLRQEVQGRLVILRARHEAQGRVVPKGSEIDSMIADTINGGSHWLGVAGPLEGHLMPADMADRAIKVEEATILVNQLGKDPAGPLFSTLAKLSQYFDLRGPILDHAQEVAGNIVMTGAMDETLMGRCSDGCLAAIAHWDKELAKSLGNAALSAASYASTEHHVQSVFICLLLASAAFESDGEWSEWLEKQLFQLALRLPRGVPTKRLLFDLNELSKVIDLKGCIHARAEALAAAA